MTDLPIGMLPARHAKAGIVRRIFFRDFALSCRMGIHDFERAGPQRIVVNVDLYLAAEPLPRADDIGEVIDYDFLRRDIATLAASRHFNLQETFVHAVCDLCLDRPGVIAVRVSSAKPDVYPDCAAVGYEAIRIKGSRRPHRKAR